VPSSSNNRTVVVGDRLLLLTSASLTAIDIATLQVGPTLTL
jgi:hypothetical protein